MSSSATTEARARLAERERRAAILASRYVRQIETRAGQHVVQRHPSARTKMPSREETLWEALVEACRDLTPLPLPEQEDTKAGDNGY